MPATYLPALLLSGFMFSIDTMPVVLRAITCVVPARYYVTVTKGIFLKGIGLRVLWVEALALIVVATVGLALAMHAFCKELA
jgi:ABC-2 type transport system permease protein